MCASQDEESDADEEKQAVWVGELDMWQDGGVVVFATSQDIEKAVADRKFWRDFAGEQYNLEEVARGFLAYKAALAEGLI